MTHVWYYYVIEFLVCVIIGATIGGLVGWLYWNRRY